MSEQGEIIRKLDAEIVRAWSQHESAERERDAAIARAEQAEGRADDLRDERDKAVRKSEYAEYALASAMRVGEGTTGDIIKAAIAVTGVQCGDRILAHVIAQGERVEQAERERDNLRAQVAGLTQQLAEARRHLQDVRGFAASRLTRTDSDRVAFLMARILDVMESDAAVDREGTWHSPEDWSVLTAERDRAIARAEQAERERDEARAVITEALGHLSADPDARINWNTIKDVFMSYVYGWMGKAEAAIDDAENLRAQVGQLRLALGEYYDHTNWHHDGRPKRTRWERPAGLYTGNGWEIADAALAATPAGAGRQWQAMQAALLNREMPLAATILAVEGERDRALRASGMWRGAATALRERCDNLQAQVAAMRTALEWYADPEHYEDRDQRLGDTEYWCSDAELDYGARAQAAIKAGGGDGQA